MMKENADTLIYRGNTISCLASHLTISGKDAWLRSLAED